MTKTLVITGFVALVALAGCNTVAGVGQDLQEGGNAIQNSAETIKRKSY